MPSIVIFFLDTQDIVAYKGVTRCYPASSGT